MWQYVVTKKMRYYPFYQLTAEQQHAIFEALHKKVPLTDEEFKAELERTKATIGAWSMPTF